MVNFIIINLYSLTINNNFINNIKIFSIDPIGQTNYQTILALTYIITTTGKAYDINATLISALNKNQIKNWSNCLDRRQVWNQKRPPWFEAILHLVYPVLDPIVHMLVVAVQTGGTIYQVRQLKEDYYTTFYLFIIRPHIT